MMKTDLAIEAMAQGADVVPETAEGYARIGDMAKKFGVSLRTLRFYEDKGLISPKRDGNTRLYTRKDKARLKLILLGRNVGFSLREVKQMLDLYDPEGSNTRQLRVALEKSDKQLARLEKQRVALDEAIGQLKEAMGIVRTRLAERQNAAGQG